MSLFTYEEEELIIERAQVAELDRTIEQANNIHAWSIAEQEALKEERNYSYLFSLYPLDV